MPTVIELADKFRKNLLKLDADSMRRLVVAYQDLYGRLGDKIEKLVLKLETQPEWTRSQVTRLAQYGELIKEIERELKGFQEYARVEISTSARNAISFAVYDTDKYLKALGYASPTMLPTKAIETMLGFLQPDGEMYKRLMQLSTDKAAATANAILEGIGLGYNPRKVAGLITKEIGMGLTESLRMARTSQLYAYREATRANYIANDNVVKGWIWWAELDSETCMSCVAMHGTVHELDETLDDHHNGRCAMLPYLGDNAPEATGKDWFEKQDEATQRSMMGKDKFDAWKGGAFQFSELSSEHKDDVYGNMRGETPLWQLLGTEPPYTTK
jgi:hypothetical protein